MSVLDSVSWSFSRSALTIDSHMSGNSKRRSPRWASCWSNSHSKRRRRLEEMHQGRSGSWRCSTQRNRYMALSWRTSRRTRIWECCLCRTVSLDPASFFLSHSTSRMSSLLFVSKSLYVSLLERPLDSIRLEKKIKVFTRSAVNSSMYVFSVSSEDWLIFSFSQCVQDANEERRNSWWRWILKQRKSTEKEERVYAKNMAVHEQ